MVGFLFGGDTGVQSAAELARKREIVNALLEPSLTMPQTFGEGLTALGRAIAGKLKDKKLSAKEDAERARVSGQFDAITSGLMGGRGGGTPSGTWTPAPPKPDALEVAQGTMQGGLSFPGQQKADLGGASGMGNAGLSFGSATMTPQEMLIAGAEKRGFNPIDVATAISYETGGTFDPMISGPTTQWGTHRGPIQFGEPQAEKYGIDFSSPNAAWRSSLDPTSGGVWKYLEDAGVKPGMGLPEIYSAINAGAVGRMGASDANNGGAPGTVADKVAGMGDHREKAAAFLGGTWTPNADAGGITASAMGGQPPMDVAALSELAANPYLPEGQRAIVGALLQQAMTPPDPMRQIELEKAQLELAQMKDPGQQAPEDYTNRMFTLSALGIDPQSDEGKSYILTGKMPEAPEPGFATLSADEVAQLGLPPGVYQRGPDGRIDTVEKTQGVADPIADLRARALAAGLTEGTPEYQQFMLNNGKTPEGMVIESDGQGGFRMVQGAGAGTAAAKPFTEGQSKDVVFATRAKGALEALEPIAGSLTDRTDSAWGALPWGLGGGQQSADFQVAETAGQEFLQAILRKDTGAAITPAEQTLYGETYLPRPGDSAERLAYKSEARKRAVAALEAGMSPAQIVAQENALAKGGGTTTPPQGAAPEGVDPAVWAVMTDEERALWSN